MHELHVTLDISMANVTLDISMAKSKRGYAWITCYFGYFHGQNKDRFCATGKVKDHLCAERPRVTLGR